MAATITERPYVFSFSENEIRYVLSVDDPLAAGCAVEFEVYWHDMDEIGVGTLLTAFPLVPNADGSIYCHVRDYLKSIVKPQLPAVEGEIIQAVPAQTKKFYIKYRQVTTAVPDPDWETEDSFVRIVVLGGVEQIKFRRNNFFVSYLPANKPFLTWQPSGRTNFVYLSQVHYLTFLNTNDALTGFTVSVKTTFTDGTTNTKTEASVLNSLEMLWRINVGVLAWELDQIDPAKKIHYYEVSVLNGAAVLAGAYRFYIDYRPLYSYWDFNFFNSVGGIDPVRIRGEVAPSVEVTADDIEAITYNNSYTNDHLQEQFSQGNMMKRDVYKGDAGWSLSRLSQEALTELLISRGIYELMDGRWIRVLNLKKSQDLSLTTDKKWSFPVEWSYGFSDGVFTPKGVGLGAGSSA